MSSCYLGDHIAEDHIHTDTGNSNPSRTSLEDKARSGRPLDATDAEMCKKDRDLV